MASQQKADPDKLLQEGEFRRIKGIAETTEQALHNYGIETFEHLAMLTLEEIDAALPGNVGVKERAARQDWMGQAVNFARLLAERGQPDEAGEAGERLHYASFMVVLLLDEEQKVRRTTLTNIQNKQPDSWAGWDPQRTANWIAEQARVSSAGPTAQQALAAEIGPIAWTSEPALLSGTPQFSPVQLIYQTSKRPRSVIYAGDPFAASLTMDLSQVSAPPDTSLRYHAALQIRLLGVGKQPQISQVEGDILPGEKCSLEFPLPGLAAGSYYLDIAVRVIPVGTEATERDGLSAMTDGILFHVKAEEPLTALVKREKAI